MAKITQQLVFASDHPPDYSQADRKLVFGRADGMPILLQSVGLIWNNTHIASARQQVEVLRNILGLIPVGSYLCVLYRCWFRHDGVSERKMICMRNPSRPFKKQSAFLLQPMMAAVGMHTM